MRWINFSLPGSGRRAYGRLDDDDRVHEIRGIPWAGHELASASYKLSEVKIEVPVVPPTFYAAGLNYVTHIREQETLTGRKIDVPPQADIGYRAVNALIAHEENVVIPEDATHIEYEGELVVVIGKKARNVSEAEALQCIFGYTIGNDVSERAWQRSDRTFWRAKNCDTFKPMGPWIETGFDPARAETRVLVNGQVKSHFNTGDMLFGIATFISRMTRYLTLYPGDIVWMGTDGHSPKLAHGDTVDVDISGLGTLRNTFVRAAGNPLAGNS
ncbi:fumarylacetoacetate hydrolase family protein [Candidimonas humi]|uniref:Fumarylacetoacetate hydrolase family protein n=1 Tax=Candidimonas humi TaxID=683355 RepID=A0ABV8P250_9BURK|nr:fumarylacetoacetate hydrolase family protein [Candidimonas humi]MBV6306960.1 fumarylacetoacetate hydrolase family protein [Candidimonas humi]